MAAAERFVARPGAHGRSTSRTIRCCARTLLRLGDDDHVLLLVSHHIASDGWSKGVMFRELSAGVRGVRGGQDADHWRRCRSSTRDFAMWQRDAAGRWCARGAARVLARAARAAAAVRSSCRPTSRARRSRASRARVGRSCLPTSLVDAAARARRWTTARRCTWCCSPRTTRCCIATAGRTTSSSVRRSPAARAEVEGLIGYFANTLVMRTSFAGDPTFAELLERICARTRSTRTSTRTCRSRSSCSSCATRIRREGDTPLFSCVLTMEDTLPGRAASSATST